LLCFVPLISAATHWELFQNFIRNHGRFFETLEDLKYRFEVFSDNMKYVEQFNSNPSNMTLGITPFSDLTHQEYRSRLSNYKGAIF